MSKLLWMVVTYLVGLPLIVLAAYRLRFSPARVALPMLTVTCVLICAGTATGWYVAGWM